MWETFVSSVFAKMLILAISFIIFVAVAYRLFLGEKESKRRAILLTLLLTLSAFTYVFITHDPRSHEQLEVMFFEKPNKNSRQISMILSQKDLVTNYEFCNFYRIVVVDSTGVSREYYLLKEHLETESLNLNLIKTDDFQKKINCPY